MPLLLTEEDVARLLPMAEAMDAVEAAFAAQARGEASNQPRARFFLSNGVMHHMAAALPARGVMGTKTYTTFAGKTRFWVQLFSTETGDLLALIEADNLGQMRTGAATGVAARYLSRADAAAAAILGAGWQARSQVAALLEARPGLRELRVFSRTPEHRAAFCEAISNAHGIPATPAESAEDAVTGAQMIVTATTAREPILKGEWLSAGTFVAAVGANRLTAREVDEAVAGRADIIAVDDPAQARVESAELLFAHERLKFSWERAVPLAQIVAGQSPVPLNPPNQITLFKSLGVALEDVAVAAVVYDKARAKGDVGRDM